MEAILRLCSGVRSRMPVRHGLVAGLAICLAVLLCPCEVRAQAVSRINGTVTEQCGWSVPDAKGTVTNVDTNVSQTAVTTSVGTYLVVDLNPGTYIVKIEKAGFKSFFDKNVVVVGGATSTANATLEPGAVTETVEVTAPEVALQTQQPERVGDMEVPSCGIPFFVTLF